MDKVQTAVTIADPALPDVPLVYANQAFLDLSGYPLRDVIGRNCRFLQGTDTAASTVAQLRSAVRQRRNLDVCLVNYTRGGDRFVNLLMLKHFEATQSRRLILGCQFVIQPHMVDFDLHVQNVEEVFGQLSAPPGTQKSVVRDTLKMRSQAMRILVEHYFDRGDLPTAR